jgi:shikimate kinase
MLDICWSCDAPEPAKKIDPEGPWAICPECGHHHKFSHLPLLVICGPAGTGKSTALRKLHGERSDVVLLDSDVLWNDFGADVGHQTYIENWLRICREIAQSGRPVVLVGGSFTPEHVEPSVYRRYFDGVYYLGMVADSNELRSRLEARPEWKGHDSEEYIKSMVDYNEYLYEMGRKDGPMTIHDTTTASVDDTAHFVDTWIDKVREQYS